MTLTEFLLARIAEDEADCADLAAIGASLSGPPYWKVSRYLAECEAKRRIVEREMGSRTRITYRRQFVLRDLAAVYADHPDYDEEWKP